MKITDIQSLWPEEKDFSIERLNTGNQYIFIHFLTPAKVCLFENVISVSEGCCILFNKFSHQYMWADDCKLIHDWFHLKGELEGIANKYGFEFNKIYKVSNHGKITNIIQTLENEFNADDVFSDSLIGLKIEELIITILKYSDDSKKSTFIDSQTLKSFSDLRAKINMTYNDDWNVEKMAAEVNLSESRFYKLYKDIFGISPKKYLQEIRIEHAKTLISRKKYMIKEIAEMTGYKNQYHFIRQFKENTGVTPGKYK